MERVKLLYRAWKYRLVDNPEEISYLLRTIKNGSVVFDAGAHKGGYTYWMRKAVGKQGQVVAFEPQNKGARLLQELFGGTNVKVEHKALSNRINTQKLFILPQEFSVSFEASLEDKYQNAVTEDIETTTVDQYCLEYQLEPSFIKIDVEGHEEKVLEGTIYVLGHSKPVLFLECEVRHCGLETMKRILSFLAQLNYSGFFFRKGKRIDLAQFDPFRDQCTELVGTKDYVNNFFFEPQ